MPVFEYISRDRQGNTVTGSLEAGSVEELRTQLRTSDLFLTKYESRGGGGVDFKKAASTPIGGGGAPKSEDIIVAVRQLSTLLRAGVPITVGVDIVRDQSTNKMLLDAMTDIQVGLVAGQSLSSLFRKYPKVFNDLVVSFTEAGEAAGNLDFCLEIAADQLERAAELKRKVSAATTYPKIVVGAAVITVVIMLLAVVPTFATVYKDLKADLPWATKTLIGLSNVVVQWWYVVAIVSGIGFFAYKRYAATPGGRQRIDSLSLKFPILGPLFRKIAIARFTQSLAGATRAGVPVLKALQISANTSGNVIIRDAVLNVAVAVRDGSAIGTELTKSGHFPPMVTRMISAGEASGDLDSMLEEINRFYERDVAYAVEKLTKMIEPLMTGVVGGIVLMVLMALYMPIFSLGKAFQNSGSK